MNKKYFCVISFLFLFFVATSAMASDYDFTIVKKQPGKSIAIYATVAQPIELPQLIAYGLDCYTKINGKHYETVMINWYVGDQSTTEKPWAVTNYDQGQAIAVIYSLVPHKKNR